MVDRKSWMSLVPDTASLGDIALPGTHDSGTHAPSFAWSRWFVPRVAKFVRCQSLTIKEQLEFGIRFLDLRFMPGGDFRLCHSSYKLDGTLKEALTTIEAFLDENDSETVIVSLKKDDNDDKRAETADELNKFLDRRGRAYLFDAPEIPTLKQARGKMVLLNRVFEKPGLGPFVFFEYNQTFTKEQLQARVKAMRKQPDGTIKEVEVEEKIRFTVQDVCDPKPGDDESAYDRKLREIKAGYERGARDTAAMRIAFLSAARPSTWTPGDMAEKINPQVRTLLRDHAGGVRWITVLDYVGDYGKGAEEPVANIISTNDLVKGAATGIPDTLLPGESMTAGMTLASRSRAYEARFQADGNFVVYRVVDDFPIAHSATNGRGGVRATLQTDGNFVVYGAGDTPLSEIGMKGSGATRLVMQDDGNLVLYAGTVAKWASQFDRFERRG